MTLNLMPLILVLEKKREGMGNTAQQPPQTAQTQPIAEQPTAPAPENQPPQQPPVQ